MMQNKRAFKTKLTEDSCVTWWRCSACKNAVAIQVESYPIDGKKSQCQHCGKKLDWSDLYENKES